MKLKIDKCDACGKLKYLPITVTEINHDHVCHSCKLCEKCGSDYMNKADEQAGQSDDTVDLTKIKTPEELVKFLSGIFVHPTKPVLPPCKCGWTESDFEVNGRMGCPACYDHFSDKLKDVVFPFHGGSEHVGKIPKALTAERMESDPIEKTKLLKLQYAKALELEEYEKLPNIKRQLDELS